MASKMTTTYLAMALALAAPSYAQQRFDSAEAAAQAMIDAAETHNTASLTAIFGPKGNAILTSGDRAQDQAEQSEFSKLARAQHQLLPDARNPNRMILSIGEEDWPFPVPIVRHDEKWSFDASESAVEMRARRIGMNELDAIEICAGYVEAQQKYASEDHDKDGVLKYASHMMSKTDGRDGLNQLVPQGLVDATWDGQKKSVKPYHGYFFRILSGQGPNATEGSHSYVVKDKLMGGFGLVAWPAQYGVTGIQTFIVNQDGVVYGKDIAPPSGGAPLPITRYDPDPTWKPAN
jgi:urease gamma subunit